MVPGTIRGLPPGLTEIYSVKPVLIPDYSQSSQTRVYSLTSALGANGGISQFLFPDYCRSSQKRDNNLTSATGLKAEREDSEFQSK